MSTNNPMTQEQLDAIRGRVTAATHGPWCHWSGWDQRDNCVKSDSREDMHTVADVIPEADDAQFIAHAREDVPALLAEVERLRARLTVDDDMVERATHAIAAHWHDMHTNESLGRQRALAIAALDAALGTGERS